MKFSKGDRVNNKIEKAEIGTIVDVAGNLIQIVYDAGAIQWARRDKFEMRQKWVEE
jgi:hypothetical protein